ncbi:hypothetical protein GTP58_29865 [Duganella sp. CY15W]|uniref:ATP-binding protein n=1 Tax=Duganella sp. CY15W TaxID=2692172 RepID=UPI0013711C2A|nr:ATP-binding protein [Duganella sp. CY15W]MYM32547.1 hypothetical protein [Duganella sp. CY15W]
MVTKIKHTFLLPVKLNHATLYPFVEAVLKGLSKRPNSILFDFSRLEGLQVGGVTVICNLMELISRMGIKVSFYAAEWCRAAEFVERSGLLALSSKELTPPRTCRAFLPIKLVEYNRSHGYVHNELVPWLAANLQCDPRALATLRVCFEEVFNNIRDHSSIEVGCSAAHFDASTGKITICVSDFGVGIPGRVRIKYETTSDHAAIELACKEGFTTQSTPGNMGAGLHILIRNVVERNSGKIVITSGNGIYTCVPSGVSEQGSKRSGRNATATYPGTLIRAQLDIRDFVPDVVEHEEFIWE